MHASTTDPDAKLYRKSNHAPAKLCFIGHALAEIRHDLIVPADATTATSRAEREAALAMIDMIEPHDPVPSRRLTLAADEGDDTRGCLQGRREGRRPGESRGRHLRESSPPRVPSADRHRNTERTARLAPENAVPLSRETQQPANRRSARPVRSDRGRREAARLKVAAALRTAGGYSLRLIHRDFHEKQVLFAGDRPVLIDFDTTCMGDPAQDVWSCAR